MRRKQQPMSEDEQNDKFEIEEPNALSNIEEVKEINQEFNNSESHD